MKSTANTRPIIWLCIIIFTLGCLHTAYLALSQAPPSWDEAHYLQGAFEIAKGLDVSMRAACRAYRHALSFKPPFVCIPAGFMIWISGGELFAGMFTMVLVFLCLGFAAYSLFRNILEPVPSVIAVSFLLTMPMVTGLTHRFYTENLLLTLCVLTLDILLRHRFLSAGVSVGIGILFGIGFLTKLTFLPLMALPFFYLIMIECKKRVGDPDRSGIYRKIFVNTGMIVIIAALVSFTWYGSGKNASMTFHHAAAASKSRACWYPLIDSVMANISSGPSVVIFLLSVTGFIALIRRIWNRQIEKKRLEAWITILLIAGVTLLITTISTNKATRFTITWLAAVAALAAYAPFAWFEHQRAALWIASAFAALLFVMTLHNSFDILPFKEIKMGNLTLLDNRYPLNVPNWFDDNHPVDRNHYPWERAADLIADDARQQFPDVATPVVRLTVNSLIFCHDYFNLLSTIRNHPMFYLWWYGTTLEGASGPHYILHGVNLHQFHQETKFEEFYPDFHLKAGAGEIPYEQIGLIQGSGNSRLHIYRKIISFPDFKQLDTDIIQEAEAYTRGNVVKDIHNFGQGIGVITTPHEKKSFAEYDLHIPQKGRYLLEIRYASDQLRPIMIRINGKEVASNIQKITGGWHPRFQAWERIALTDLNEGKNTIRIESESLFPHLDKFLLRKM
ncbi:MAG: hypothetical protein C4522_22285 [Desulfobacteraceae bacterium]|nr:MAG: hypothetical protein C4522_22285 [Desulfobacteraceae bacterium]